MSADKASKTTKPADRTPAEDRAYLRRRRILGLVSLAVVLALAGVVTYFVCTDLLGKIRSPEEFRAYIESFGWTGRLVFLGLQCLQVIVAMIPGEILEVGAGYAFGAVEGTLLCMGGVAIASAMIFLLTKRLGVKLVETFISREKIDELRFINSEKKLKRLIFILFFIPGTPKDLFTYFAGLTRIKLSEFLVISLIARIPSVVSPPSAAISSDRKIICPPLFFCRDRAGQSGRMAVYTQIVKRHEKGTAGSSKGRRAEITRRRQAAEIPEQDRPGRRPGLSCSFSIYFVSSRRAVSLFQCAGDHPGAFVHISPAHREHQIAALRVSRHIIGDLGKVGRYRAPGIRSVICLEETPRVFSSRGP